MGKELRFIWFFLAVMVVSGWMFPKTAIAQNPYHCDSLKLTFFDKEKIVVKYFQASKSCLETCSFCKSIEKQDWLEVQNQLKIMSETFHASPEPFTNFRSLLLAHRWVNFVLPPDQDAQQKKIAAMPIGFQVPHMTYTWNAAFKLTKPRKNKPSYWKFSTFTDYHQIYPHLNHLAENFRTHLKSDSLQMPPPLLPDQNYLASLFGTRNLSWEEKTRLETRIRENPRQVVAEMVAAKDGIGLVMMMAHQNLAVRYLALTGIKKIQDKNCLPYLLQLTQYTINNPLQTTPETDILHANYCEQLVSTVGILTNSGFNRCPFAHYGAHHYLKMGLPDWERKIEHRQSQGIGSYAELLRN